MFGKRAIWTGVATLMLLPSTAFAQEGKGADPYALQQRPEAQASFESWYAGCRGKFDKIDARIDAAGVRDAGFYRIPGFPYMRTDRLLAAFRNKVETFESIGDWTAQLRENDTIAREIELNNMGMSDREIYDTLNDLRVCAVWLTNIELEDPTVFKAFVNKVEVPNQYPELRDAPGQDAVAAAASAPSSLVRWRPLHKEEGTQVPPDFSGVTRDNLGRIGLLMNVWRAVVEKHAPEFAIDTAGDYDRPGAIVFAGDKPTVSADKPAVYYMPGFARVHGRTLVQLNYFIWFSAHPAATKADPEAGTLDSLIWRVTLDDDGQPLVYESVAGSGAHHRWYPAKAIKLRAGMAAQVRVAGTLAPAAASVRIASATHAVANLSVRSEGAPQSRQYELIPYEDLLILPAAEGTRSLFGPDGVARGSERPHGAKVWPAGFPKPGAMRQWGHHVVSFTRGSYFDDPMLLDRVFDLPPPVERTASLKP